VAKDLTTVMWLDPGMTTGLATYGFFSDTFYSCQLKFHDLGEYLDVQCNWLGEDLHLGWELYLNTPGSFGKPDLALEPIGVARYLAVKHGCVLLQPQPSSARKLGSDDKLKRLGWYKPGQRHANDASNHLLSYLLRERKLPGHLTDLLCTS